VKPASPTHQDQARQRLAAIDAEVLSLRGPPPIPSLRPDPLPIRARQRLLDLFAEGAVHHVTVGELDAARRATADAIALMDESIEVASVARASLLVGEALVEMDSPVHARARLEEAVRFFDRLRDDKLATRARIALARALVLLDDPGGLAMLRESHAAALERGDFNAVARIDAVLQDATSSDLAETVRAGYGRAVSIPPSIVR
jgi:hypothetical protein